MAADKIADAALRTRLPVGATILLTWRFLLRSAGTYLLQTITGAFILMAIGGDGLNIVPSNRSCPRGSVKRFVLFLLSQKVSQKTAGFGG
jgi:hypothetical protein